MIPKRLKPGDTIGIVSPSKILDEGCKQKMEFGHKCPNTPLPIGGLGAMDAAKLSFRLVEPCVR